MEFLLLPTSSEWLVLLLWWLLIACVLPAMAAAVGAERESVIEMYLRDIVGGSNPTAHPTTGLLGSIYSGQGPYATPVGSRPHKEESLFLMPMVLFPLLMELLASGLSGITFAGNNNNQNNLQSQLAADLLGLGFGTITAIDDVLTLQPELGSQAIERAQGIYVARSADGSRQMMVFTAMFEGGDYGDSMNFYGVYKIGSAMSRLSITSGTGKFKNARGFAEVRSLIPPGQIASDGLETLLRLTVHLYHY